MANLMRFRGLNEIEYYVIVLKLLNKIKKCSQLKANGFLTKNT